MATASDIHPHRDVRRLEKTSSFCPTAPSRVSGHRLQLPAYLTGTRDTGGSFAPVRSPFYAPALRQDYIMKSTYPTLLMQSCIHAHCSFRREHKVMVFVTRSAKPVMFYGESIFLSSGDKHYTPIPKIMQLSSAARIKASVNHETPLLGVHSASDALNCWKMAALQS